MIELGKQLKYFYSGILPRDVDKIPTYQKYNNDFLYSVGVWREKGARGNDDNKFLQYNTNNMVDSGGYAIQIGAKTSLPFRECSEWQLRNGMITFIRDTGVREDNTLEENKMRAVESYENGLQLIRMKEEMNSKAKIYNVLHGASLKNIDLWYENLKGLNTDGWSFGSAGSQYNLHILSTQMVMALYILKHEEDKKHNFHFFAPTSKEDIAILLYFIREFEDRIDTVSFDNTSPAKQAVFMGYSFPLFLTAMNIGKLSKIHGNNLKVKNYESKPFCGCEGCKGKTFNDIYNTSTEGLPLHNYIQYIEGIKFIIFTMYNMDDLYNELMTHTERHRFCKKAIDTFKRTGEITNIPVFAENQVNMEDFI